jgi:hypothetical protein
MINLEHYSPISIGQQQILANPPYNESSITRFKAYKEATPESFTFNKLFLLHASREVTGQLLYGVGVMAAASSWVIYELAQDKKVAAAASAALVEAGVAGVAGVMVTAAVAATGIAEVGIVSNNLYNLVHSDAYVRWTEQRVEIKINDKVQEFFCKDIILKEMLCPLSGNLITCPVYLPNGKHYDFFKLKDSLIENPLILGFEFDLGSVEFSYATANRIRNRLRILLTFPISKMIAEDCRKISKELTAHKVFFLNKQCSTVQSDFAEGKDSSVVYNARLTDIRRQYRVGDAESPPLGLLSHPPAFEERVTTIAKFLPHQGLAELVEEFIDGEAEGPEELRMKWAMQWQEAAVAKQAEQSCVIL